ncbi:MAG: (Fe-S)-binding protein [Deltaproteobacteria bacterium]|nr:(Fe-S)-binding protein [Deltaproteobacteria bacterium]
MGTRFRWFKEDVCDRCGVCLEKCPVLGLSKDDAVQDIKRLISGDVGHSLAFMRCTTCNICDINCPKDADPYELILECFDNWGKRWGLPYFAKMVFPNEPENIWSCIRPLMGPDEVSLLHTWEKNLDILKEEVLLTGFYTNLVPYLAQAKVLDELRPVIAGSEGLWGCGGDTNKLGLIDLTQQVVELLENKFSKMGLKRVYCFMEAEAAMLKEVLPARFGAKFDFDVQPLDYWILESLEDGKIEVKDRLNIKVTVHDNCMSRYLGGRPQEVVREIARSVGCDMVEMKHTRLNALCCGWAATVSTVYGENSDNLLHTLFYMLSSLYMRLEEAEATGADAIVTSCPACYIFLNLISMLTNSRMAVYHPLEIVEMAAGHSPNLRIRQRCWDILSVATNLMFNWLASKENRTRFFPRHIDTTRIEPLPVPRDRDIRRIKAISSFYRSSFVQNPVTKALIGYVLRLGIAVYRYILKRQKIKITKIS